MIRDFDFEGILSVAFPCFSCNGAYDWSISRNRKLTIKEMMQKAMRRRDNAIEKHPDLVSYCQDYMIRRDNYNVCL